MVIYIFYHQESENSPKQEALAKNLQEKEEREKSEPERPMNASEFEGRLSSKVSPDARVEKIDGVTGDS